MDSVTGLMIAALYCIIAAIVAGTKLSVFHWENSPMEFTESWENTLIRLGRGLLWPVIILCQVFAWWWRRNQDHINTNKCWCDTSQPSARKSGFFVGNLIDKWGYFYEVFTSLLVLFSLVCISSFHICISSWRIVDDWMTPFFVSFERIVGSSSSTFPPLWSTLFFARASRM